MTQGRIALVGSGEYLPVMQDIEAWLLKDRPSKYVQLATAAAPEGDISLAHWHDLGAQAAARLSVEQVVIDVRDRDDANNPEWAELIAGAGLIYLSGGNPSYLAQTLRDTKVWAAIVNEWNLGASIAGCSAGAMAMCGYVPDFRHPRSGGVNGLGVLPHIRVLPHFDRLSHWMPDFTLKPLVSKDAETIGVDEDTALIGESNGTREWEFRSVGRLDSWQIQSSGKRRIDGTIPIIVMDPTHS